MVLGRLIMFFKVRSYVLLICIYYNWCLGCILKFIVLIFCIKKDRNDLWLKKWFDNYLGVESSCCGFVWMLFCSYSVSGGLVFLVGGVDFFF